jgi:hypothetical protein
MLLTSRWPRSVRDRREERSDVELERHRRASGRPNESLIDDRRTLIVGMPDFERLGVAVDDAIVRHSIPPKRAALGDPIVAGGSGDRFSQIKMGSSFPKAEVGARRPSVEQRIDPARIALPMLINEYARSGGDELPWLFRYFKIGPLIGKRTWGGLVGIGGYPTLMDGGAVTAPRVGIWSAAGDHAVENKGVAPDVDVELDPAAWRTGHDSQLERAVAIVMQEPSKQTAAKPKRPSFPDWAKPARP